ncbi:MAG: hypothetical protein R3B40_31590 [Polyangiales bacterium]
MSLRVLVFVGVAVGTLCVGCHAEPAPAPEPLCVVPQPRIDENTTRPLRTSEWLQFLVGASEGTVATDCSGHAIEDPVDHACQSQRGTLAAAALTEESLMTVRIDYDHRLQWVQTHTNAAGDRVGPVALVERTETGWAVRAMGTITAPPGRPRLRLEALGSTTVLVAQGERCTDPEDPESCESQVRLWLRQGDRFEATSLRLDDRDLTCAGPAMVDISRTTAVPLPNGWQRTFRLSASVEYRGGDVLVHEQVVVHDNDPNLPGVPPTPFRVIDSDRTLAWRDGYLVTSLRPLWDRSLEELGSVALTEEERARRQ